MRRLWKWNKDEPLFGDADAPLGMAAILMVTVVVLAVGALLLTVSASLL